MLRFLVTSLVNAVGLFVATQLIPQVNVLGGLFGIVNAVISPVIKVLAAPLYIITFGLIAFVINGAMLLLVSWLSRQIGVDVISIEGFTEEGLSIASLGWAILAAIVMALASFVTRFLLRILKIK